MPLATHTQTDSIQCNVTKDLRTKHYIEEEAHKNTFTILHLEIGTNSAEILPSELSHFIDQHQEKNGHFMDLFIG